MVKPVVKVAGILLLCLSLTGCWDATAIDKLAIVTMSGLDVPKLGAKMGDKTHSGEQEGAEQATDPSTQPKRSNAAPTEGIDKETRGKNAPVQLTMQIARVAQLGSGQSGSGPATGSSDNFVVVRAVGATTMDALEHARNEVSRRLYLAQRQVVVLGEDYARQGGAMDILDEVVRNPFSRLRTDVLVAYHTQAAEILRRPYLLNRLPSDAVHGLERESPVPHVNANEFLRNLTGQSDPYAVGIEPLHTACTGEPNTFNLEHVAVFQKDRLVGWLEGKQVVGFMWLTDRMKNRYTSIAIPNHSGYVGTRLLRARTHRQVRLHHGHPEVWLTVQTENDIAENTTHLNLSHSKDEALLLDSMRGEIEAEIRSALTQLQQETHSDAAGFGELIYRHYPATWRQLQPHWRQEYTRLPVHIQVQVVLQRAGMTGKNLYPQGGNP
ncbi:Ger(x)C family spore germination protein [Alicyclobacillaceae bacterium I2511]|nr:Ger(x)C family spore germination protein [Alicyclobacillaceae bacterium I2511]